MKLFSKSEVRSSSKQIEEQKIIEIGVLEKTLVTLQNRINTENDHFTKRMEQQRQVYSEEKVLLQNEITVLERKLKELHEQRATVIIPSMELIDKAKATLKNVQDKFKAVSLKEEELDTQLEIVHARLDDISTREGILKESGQKLLIRKEAIESEAKMVSDGHIRLNGMLLDFEKEVTSKTKILNEREKTIEAREKMLQSTLEEHTKQIQKDLIIINEKRQGLDRAFAELNLKQNG